MTTPRIENIGYGWKSAYSVIEFDPTTAEVKSAEATVSFWWLHLGYLEERLASHTLAISVNDGDIVNSNSPILSDDKMMTEKVDSIEKNLLREAILREISSLKYRRFALTGA